MADIASLMVRVGADVAGALSGLARVDSAMGRLGGVAVGAGKAMVAGLAVAGAAVTGLGVVSAKSAIDFESSFAGVRKTVNATEEQFKALEGALREMAKVKPVDVNVLNQIAESAGQLGVAKEHIVGFTATIADLAVATNLTADQAAEDLARFANIMSMPLTDIGRLGSTIVELGNNSATTERDIVALGMRIAGAGKVIGLTEAQVMGFAAGVSSLGIESEAGGTAISRTFIDMGKAVATGGDKLEGFAKAAGMSVTDFSRLFKEDAAEAVVSFIEGLGRIRDEGGDVFSFLEEMDMDAARLTDTMLRASGGGDLLRKSVQLGTDAWRENNALTKEAAERYKTTASQMQLAGNRIADLGITIGQALLPLINQALQGLKPFIEAFAARLPAAIQVFKDSVETVKQVFAGEWNSAAIAFVQQKFTELQATMSALAPTGERIGAAFNAIVAAVTPLAAQFTAWATSAETATGAATLLQTAGDLAAGAINGLSGAIEAVVTWFNQSVAVQALVVAGLTAWGVAAGIAAVTSAAHAVGLGILTAATSAYTAVQWLLNAALTANPIGIMIVAAAALAAAFIYLYANSEEFRAGVETLGTTTDIVGQGMIAIAGRMDAEMGAAFTTLRTTADIAGQALSAMFARVIAAASEAIAAIIQFGKDIATTLETAARTAGAQAAAIGTAIIDGIKGAISAGLESVRNAAAGVATAALNAAKAAIGAQSPSRKFAEQVGAPIVEGIVEGINKKAPSLYKTMEELARKTASVSETAFGGAGLGDVMSGASGGRKGRTADLVFGGAGLGDTMPILGAPSGTFGGAGLGDSGPTSLEAESVAVTSTGPVTLTSTMQQVQIVLNLPGGSQIVALVLAEPPAVAALADGIGQYNSMQTARGA